MSSNFVYQRTKMLLGALFFFVIFSPPTVASELARFNETVAGPFEHYRSALFYLETDNAAVAAIELDAMKSKWQALVESFRAAPPDPFSDDPHWAETLSEVTSAIDTGLAAAEKDDAKTAKTAIAPIRNLLGDLRRRNGVWTYSDCIAEMNEQMTKIWVYRREPPDFESLEAVNKVKTAAAVYGYLLERCRAAAPAAHKKNEEFIGFFDGARNSLETLWDAVDKKQENRFINILRELHPFDRMIFLRFG